MATVEPGRCNCTALRKASRRLSQMYDCALAPSGLRSTQFAILAQVERREGESLTIHELAEALVMDPSTIGQNLRPLEREALISLQRDDSDRRRRQVRLTKKGRARLHAAGPLWTDAQERFEAGFGRGAAADLRGILNHIASDASLFSDGETAGPEA
jgi:DNA-binding MarR family transcriptional regulator